MKILAVADTERRELWDFWNENTAERLRDVSLILSAGDLHPDYLEFLVTMLNVPLVYVRGNHDGMYDYAPPQGCISAEGEVLDVECRIHGGGSWQDAEKRLVRIAGLGGSMRYKSGPDMYNEREMAARTRRIGRRLGVLGLRDRLASGRSDMTPSGEPAPAGPGSEDNAASDTRSLDILLTHAPCRGFGDMDDLPHTGFKCFNSFLNKYHPAFHIYGHVHKEYSGAYAANAPGSELKGYHSRIEHPSGTALINAAGCRILELP